MKGNAKRKKGRPVLQADSVREFFQRMSFLERLSPVLAAMGRILCPEENETQCPAVPGYCHKILAVFRKTYFKNFPALVDMVCRDKESQRVIVDWRLLGQMIGIGLRCLRFSQHELGEQPALTPAQEQEFLQLFVGGKDGNGEPGEGFWNESAERISASLMAWNQAAYQWGPEALAQLNAGVAVGVRGFMDETGAFVGESNRANIYWFLLLAWPEISQMQKARPPITRNDFAAWLEPFAKADLVSLRDVDQLHDVCDDIGLRFKKAGRPQRRN